MPVSRKRPLLAAKVAPPPKTATTLALEKILDGKDAKARHKKKLLEMKRKKQGTLSSLSIPATKPSAATTNSGNSNRLTNPLSRATKPAPSNPFARSSTTSKSSTNRWSQIVQKGNQKRDAKDVFASGNGGLGGLANVPGFRKASKTVARKSSSSTFSKHAKPKKAKSLTTVIRNVEDDGYGTTSGNDIAGTIKSTNSTLDSHKRPRLLGMSKSPFFSSEPTDSLAQSKPPTASNNAAKPPSGPNKSNTTKESSFSRLPSKPTMGLRLTTHNSYRSSAKDNRRRLVSSQKNDDDDDIEVINVLPAPKMTKLASPESSSGLFYDSGDSESEDEDYVEVVKVVQSPDKEQPVPDPAPKPKPPPKKKKVSHLTASLLKSTENTHRLLSGENDKKPAPVKPKNNPPPTAALPAYQLRSDVVMAHREEKESRGKEKQVGSHASQHAKDSHISKPKKPVDAKSSSRPSSRSNPSKINDNFVRLNMRNGAGSCRGARNKKKRNSKWEHRGYPGDRNSGKENNENANKTDSTGSRSSGHFYTSRRTGLDPLDDYVDGVFHQKLAPKDPKKVSEPSSSNIPKCARHQRPCKLAVVKKNTTGNKGRKFYCCSMPRGEQCNHFEWADDTLEAARAALANNDTSCSGFIGRQVQAYVERFRTLTVPELRLEATKRGLKKTGKKKELLYRLAFWARDEIASSVHEQNVENIPVPVKDDDSDSDGSSDEDSDDSEDELELFHNDEEEEEKKKPSKADDDESSCGSMEFDDAEATAGSRPKSKDKKLSMHDVLSQLFGHASFRDGQEWAIQRCLENKKSLLVAPTGFGKSLCYALPASMLDGISVVISPLVSLIQDQLRALPPRVPAATLSGSLSVAKTAAIIDDIIYKRIKILFVSPERLASPSFQRLFRTKWNPNTNQYERKFPDISLLCIDEAHCVSQWAHNFRPCFLRFQSILALMAPKSILAITATAGPRVIDDICQTIGIHEGDKSLPDHKEDSVRVLESGRDNIDVSCHFVTNIEERLIMLAKILSPRRKEKQKASASTHFGSLAKGSVIVYVWRQKDTEVVAEHLNASGVEGGVVVYHGGMDAGARSRSQSMFMRGKARICVATVAFGMGIDKADVVGVVHMYLSSSPEHYMQEIGRAGRDGRQAKAIALPMMEEVPRRHSLEHSSIISKSQIRSLLFAIREVVKSSKRSMEEAGNLPLQIALPVRDAVLGCDCKSETIETLLSLIEQSGGNDPYLQVVGFNYDRAFIALKKRSLEKLAEREAVASSIRKICQCFNPPIGEEKEETETETTGYQVPESFQRQFLAYSLGSYTFSVVDCATVLGPSAEPRHVFAALRRLQSSNELEMSLDTSDGGRVFHLRVSPRGHAFFASDDFDGLASELTDTLYQRFTSSIFSGASKVLDMAYIMNEVGEACKTSEILDTGKSTNLVRFQELCENYLDGKLTKSAFDLKDILPPPFSNVKQRDLNADIMTLVQDLPQLAKRVENVSFATVMGEPKCLDYSALAVTKFLHGIDSPRVPLLSFRNHPLFGRWEGAEFALVHEAVTEYLTPSEEAAA